MLIDVVGGEETVLSFDVPTLGDVAPSVFDQGEFASTNRPSPENTGFDVLADGFAISSSKIPRAIDLTHVCWPNSGSRDESSMARFPN